MRTVFADAFYWIALLNRRDQWHQSVRDLNRTLNSAQFVTTDEVLTEFLNFFSGYEPRMRQSASLRVQNVLQSDQVQVIPASRDNFIAGLALYGQRLDNGYSLTDCISMQIMTQLGIREILTNDKHFNQEGFVILFQ